MAGSGLDQQDLEQQDLEQQQFESTGWSEQCAQQVPWKSPSPSIVTARFHSPSSW